MEPGLFGRGKSPRSKRRPREGLPLPTAAACRLRETCSMSQCQQPNPIQGGIDGEKPFAMGTQPTGPICSLWSIWAGPRGCSCRKVRVSRDAPLLRAGTQGRP